MYRCMCVYYIILYYIYCCRGQDVFHLSFIQTPSLISWTGFSSPTNCQLKMQVSRLQKRVKRRSPSSRWIILRRIQQASLAVVVVVVVVFVVVGVGGVFVVVFVGGVFVVDVVVTALHKLVPQQDIPPVMLAILCKKDRPFWLVARSHRFEDIQPKSFALLDPLVTFTQRFSTPWHRNSELHWEVVELQVKHVRLFGWAGGKFRFPELQLLVLQHWRDPTWRETPHLKENVWLPVAGHREDGTQAPMFCGIKGPDELTWIEAVTHIDPDEHVDVLFEHCSSAPAVLESAQMRVRERIIMMIK